MSGSAESAAPAGQAAGAGGARSGGEPLTPYVSPDQHLPELTASALVLGTLLSAAFGLVNAYLALKVGLTASASIPAAVLSMAILRGLLRRGTILENNVVQSIASAGDSLAAGVAFTIPALLFLGLAPSEFRLVLMAATAGCLGVLMMVPLRHELTVAEHGRLAFPEGSACAAVLIAGDRGRAQALPVFIGIALGGLYQLAMRGLGLWRESVFASVGALHKLSIGAELTPLFLGVGYLIGARIAALMLCGGLLAWMVLIPLFDATAGGTVGAALGLPPDLASQDAWHVWRTAVRFVGAGAVACGGAWSIARAVPEMHRALMRRAPRAGASARIRTERDLSGPVIIGGVLLCGGAMWLVPAFEMGLPEVLLALVFAYFFVLVSARIVGLIGTTSQPVSGMTIAALLAAGLVLRMLGYEGTAGMAATLSVAAIVCTAIAIGGDISQDLKCGALVGATPRALEVGQIVGALAAALRVGWALSLLHSAYTIGSAALPAPQAKLMATLAQGVMHGELPWALLALGAVLAAAVELAGFASLPFAIGLYLPITTSASLIFGGLIAEVWKRRGHGEDPATLFGSGLIAGDALLGVVFAGLIVAGYDGIFAVRTPAAGGWFEAGLTLAAFAALALVLIRYARRAPAS
ncbi:MAG: OPT family oligopeptide transporter [Candidatus Binatia bacterium]